VIAKRESNDDRQWVFMAVQEGIKEIRVGTVSTRAIMGGLKNELQTSVAGPNVWGGLRSECTESPPSHFCGWGDQI
jgi:hypothetical protein